MKTRKSRPTTGPAAHARHRRHGHRKYGIVRRLFTQAFSTLIAPLIVGLTLQGTRGCDPGPIHALPSPPAATARQTSPPHPSLAWKRPRPLSSSPTELAFPLNGRDDGSGSGRIAD